MDNTSNWGEVEAHIERHEGGCWTWDGTPVGGNVYRIVAEAYGAPLPPGTEKLYRMPDCKLGRACMNPNHIGTANDYFRAAKGRRQEIPELQKTGAELKLTPRDRRFLKGLRIRWE
jgi:hypothetical protein